MEKELAKKKEKNLLEGPMALPIIAFALPLAFSSLLQQFFNSADVAVVGNFAGSDALAAVGANVANVGIFVNFIVGASIGPNVVIAKLIGQGRRAEINKAIHSIMLFAIELGLILLGIGQALAYPLVAYTGTPSNVVGEALVYLRIYLLGLPFMVVYNFGAAIIRSKGETVFPLICMIVTGVVNVALNFLFVLGFHIPVSGVAIATTTSNVISSIMIVVFLMRDKAEFKFSFRKLKSMKSVNHSLIWIGFPAGVQSMVFSISNVFIQVGINSFGAQAIAGSSVGLNFEYYSYAFSTAFAQAAITFYSQNLGARKYDRCKKAFHLSLFEGLLFAETLSLIFTFGRVFFARFYTNVPLALDFAYERMLHVELLEGFTVTYEVMAGILRSRGHSLAPAIITILWTVVFRIIWMLFIFPVFHTFGELLNVYPISWFLCFFTQYIYYRVTLHREKENPALS